VATAFPIRHQPVLHNLQNNGNYGHMTENILTSRPGPDGIAPGSHYSHLRGAAPPVSRKAAPKLLNKRQQRLHTEARELAEALDDCRDDPQDNCQTELHLHDAHLKAFEKDQDSADRYTLLRQYLYFCTSNASKLSSVMPQGTFWHVRGRSAHPRR
jgi:hypothetical protein